MSRRLWSTIGGIALATAPPAARGAEDGFQLDGLEHRAPATGRLGVVEPSTLPPGGFSASVVTALLEEPLVLAPATPGDDRAAGAVVSRRIGLQVAGAWAPTRWAAAHGALPVTASTSTGRYGTSTRDALSRGTLGDARLGLDVSLFSLFGFERPLGLELALDATLWLPTGDAASLTGEGSPRAQPTMALSSHLGPLQAAATVGWHFRPVKVAYNVRRDDEVRLGAMVSSGLPLLGGRVSGALQAALPTADTVRPFDPDTGTTGAARAATAVVEALLGLELRSERGFRLELGAGRGLTDAAGSPSARAWLGLGYSTPAEPPVASSGSGPDRDSDGVPDATDDCPYEAEDADGERDADGCPEGPPAGFTPLPGRAAGPMTAGAPPRLAPLPPLRPLTDADADGRTDDVDACPDIPEDVDGFADADGCPEPDDDSDGVLDAADRCPWIAETANGVSDADGCPDIGPDADTDGVEDRLDACPTLPETPDGIRDHDGCPESPPMGPPLAPLPPLPLGANRDADLLRDGDDLCPAAAEDPDGFADGDGCPDPDDDADGVLDARDACPRVAGPPGSADGCPVAGPDADADGVADAVDACPSIPEFRDGVRDEDGCPEGGPSTAAGLATLAPLLVGGDPDADGLTGAEDDCPADAEDRDGFADGDGCPEPDDDADAVPDGLDACPREAETPNAWLDGDGCPDAPPPEAIGLPGAVPALAFVAGTDRLVPAAVAALDRVADVLRARADLSLRVDVFAAPSTATLRAVATREALLARGIAPTRLTARALAPDGPERVELHFLNLPRETPP